MKFIERHYKLILLSIPLISLALHFHILNTDLIGYHVWRQTETQTVINNFYREDLNILNPHINDHADTDRLHRMEFPVMQWIFALFYKLFGPHIAVTRVLTFIMGVFSVLGMFYLTRRAFNNVAIATICAWCFNFSPVFYYYTVNPLPDNMAMCCGIWSLGMFCSYIRSEKLKYVVWSAVFLCLATMAKLPFILYGIFFLPFIVISLRKRELNLKKSATIILTYTIGILPAFLWYAWVIPKWTLGIRFGIFDRSTHADLSYIIWRTLISILPELLINYGSVLFFLCGFYFLFRNKEHKKKYFPLFLSLSIAVLCYYVYEMNFIDVIHDYYLFPFLPLIFIITAYGAWQLLALKHKFATALSILCLSILPLTAFLRADTRWDEKNPEFNPTYYKYKNELRSLTPKDALCVVGYDDSHYILLYYIDRKGWAFDKSWFDEQLLAYYISKGAQYIFLDEQVDPAPIKDHLGEKIFDKENLRVYKLK